MKAQLFILGGRDVGRSFDIGAKAVLGRAPECEVRLRDRSISRKHAVVRATEDGWVVEDLGSRNGLKFRGARVPDAQVLDHDEFELGDVPIRFRLAEAPEAPGDEPVELAAPPAPVGQPAAHHDELEDEIQLEEEVELEASADTVTAGHPRAEPSTRREPVRLEPLPDEEEPELSDYERRRAQILSESKRTGFLRGDLSQRPVWVKLLVGLFVTALALGMTGLVFWLMQKVRGSL